MIRLLCLGYVDLWATFALAGGGAFVLGTLGLLTAASLGLPEDIFLRQVISALSRLGLVVSLVGAIGYTLALFAPDVGPGPSWAEREAPAPVPLCDESYMIPVLEQSKIAVDLFEAGAANDTYTGDVPVMSEDDDGNLCPPSP